VTKPRINPVYIKLLIGAAAVFVVSVSLMLSNIYDKLGRVEHALSHITGGAADKCGR